MNLSSFKKIFFSGIALAIPLGVVTYVFIKLLAIFEEMISPLAKKFGVEKVLGEVTLTVLTILILLVIMFLLGLLMRFSVVTGFRKGMEEVVLKFIPSLNHLKTMAADKLDFDHATNLWKPVLIHFENKYSPAFMVEENEELVTLFVTKGTSLDEGEILIANKKEISFSAITATQMKHCSKQFGKGYIAFIKPV